MEFVLRAVLIGLGATLLLDAWSVLQSRLFKTPPPDFTLLGRWVGHFPSGRFVHATIADAASVKREALIGLAAHYVIGIVFAAMLLAICGAEWARQPTPLPPIAFGIVTVAAPYFILQPAMGSGFAASRTPDPNAARLKSLLTHTVFGVTLFIAAYEVSLVLA